MWRFVGLVMLVACGSAPRGGAGDKSPPAAAGPFARSALDKPAFTATPAELLAIAKTQPAGEWVVLRDERRAAWDEAGTVVDTQRTVFVVGPFEEFQRVHWFDESTTARPTIRVRVIRADGTANELEPSGFINDHAAISYTVPELVPGVLIEEQVSRTIRPRVDRDNFVRHRVGWQDAPVLQTRIVVSVPKSLEPTQLARLAPGARMETTEADGRRTWTWDVGKAPRTPDDERWQPEAGATGDQVAVATGLSWKALAAAYHPIVEQALGPPIEWPAGLAKEPRAIARWVRMNVAHGGLDISDATLHPQSAASTLAHGGSPLDMSVVLVALLRAANIPADLVLVDHMYGDSLLETVPSLRQFEHTLVRARPSTGGEHWFCLDSHPSSFGRLLQDDRDRPALVIAADTTDLIRTPAAKMSEHGTNQVRTITLADWGPASVSEVTVERGDSAMLRHSGADSTPEPEYGELLAAYVREKYQGSLSKHTLTLGTDTTLDLAIAKAEAAVTGIESFTFDISLADVFGEVPDELFDPEAGPRRTPFYWRVPHTYVVEHRFVLPTGFALPPVPADGLRRLGGKATITEQWRTEGTTLVVQHRFESGEGTITPAEFDQLRASLMEVSEQPSHVLIALHASELLVKGKPAEALAELEALVRAHPRNAVHRRRLAYVLVDHGLGAAGQRAAREAIKIAPRDPDAQITLAWTLQHDRFGRLHGAGWDRAGALAAYARARTLDPTHALAAREHGRLLLAGTNGVEIDPGAQPSEAADALGAAYKLDGLQSTGELQGVALVHARRFADALRALQPLEPSPRRDGLMLAANAMVTSPEAALATLDPAADASKIVEEASRALLRLREYDRARPIAARDPKGATNQMLVAIPGLANTPPVPAKTKDPIVAARGALEASIGHGNAGTWAWDRQTRDDVIAEEGRDVAMDKAITVWGSLAIRDLFLSLFSFNTTGEPGGPWRVELTSFAKAYYFVALDRGQAKVIGSPIAPRGVGRHVLRLVKASSLDDAGQLVEWIAPLLRNRELGGLLASLPRTKEDLQLAGALLAVDGSMLPLLKQCARDQCAALVVALETDGPTRRMLRATERGDLAAAITEGEAAVKATPSKFLQNQLAWLRFLQGNDLARALELANAAVGDDVVASPRPPINTRAAILVELGRYREALSDLAQAYINGRRRELLSDVYVYGRIAERLGYAADAKARYREVSKGPDQTPISVEMLAKQRL